MKATKKVVLKNKLNPDPNCYPVRTGSVYNKGDA